MRRKNATNEFLKQCIADALIKLMQTKPIDDITISEITDLADVGRVTYYRNFTSKEDILAYKLDILFDKWGEDACTRKGAPPYQLAVSFYHFINSIKELLLLLYQANLSHILLNSFVTYCKPQTEDRVEIFAVTFYAYGIFGLTTEWLNSGMKETPEEMGDIIVKKIFQFDENDEKLKCAHVR